MQFDAGQAGTRLQEHFLLQKSDPFLVLIHRQGAVPEIAHLIMHQVDTGAGCGQACRI